MGEIDGKARVSEASGNAVFDASQYDFFGKQVMEEVELGGLEDDSDDFGLVDDDDKDYQSFLNKSSEEGELIDLPDIDDISSSFSQLNRTISEPQSTLKVGGSDSFSNQSSLNGDWVQQPSFSKFHDQPLLNTENVLNTQQWPSQQQPFPLDPKSLYRTTSYPHQPLPNQHHISSKPALVPKPSLSSYLLSLPNQSQFSPPNQSHFSPPIHVPHGLQQFQHENTSQQFGPSNLPINMHQQVQPHWQNQPNPHPGLLSQRFNQMRPHMYQPPRPPNQIMAMRQFHRPLFRSKYMSSEEIDNIIRIQHVATHSSDPYTDDYYHQACLAKRSSLSNSRLRHHFCPNSITELSSRPKANSEPHAFLQVEGLGRLPFSSIRRPRPLLELDSKPDPHNEKTIKPLEQETMLAARIAIEDGLSLLLDIDDVDRFLQFNQAHEDGGTHLRHKRQNLLEGLATSLQLVDPLSHTITQKDDLVFLRIVSLPKGRKFISRYLKLLHPSDDVARIVCMAVFRHLRFLFGDMPSDSSASKATTDLMLSVSSTVSKMELGALSACLAAVVCSSEQPPLRPIGNSAGDCASVVVKTLLDRATELLTDQRATVQHHVVRNMWQESFNAFFSLLTKYCVAKFDTLARAVPVIGGEIAQAISSEMPVELLRASLPHTDEAQRRLLREFAQRSMPVMNHASNGGSNGPTNSESVRS